MAKHTLTETPERVAAFLADDPTATNQDQPQPTKRSTRRAKRDSRPPAATSWLHTVSRRVAAHGLLDPKVPIALAQAIVSKANEMAPYDVVMALDKCQSMSAKIELLQRKGRTSSRSYTDELREWFDEKLSDLHDPQEEGVPCLPSFDSMASSLTDPPGNHDDSSTP